MVRIRPLLAILLASSATAASGEVFKCVDAAGNVTYQQERCSGGAKGAPVELRTDNAQSQDPADRDGRWRIAAEQGTVIPGMPKRWVQQALGQPREIRRGTAVEGVAEVWEYQTARGLLRVGFRTNAVEWSRVEGPGATAAASGTGPARAPTATAAINTTAAAPAPIGMDPPRAVTRGAGAAATGGANSLAGAAALLDASASTPAAPGEVARSRVTADRRCDDVLAELGPAARREPLQAGGERPVEAMRYAYEPLPGGLPLRLSFTCIDGRIANVSRDVVR